MLTFAETAEALRKTRDKQQKLDLVTAYSRGLSHTQLPAAVRFLAGSRIRASDGKPLSVHGSVFRKLAWNLFEIDEGLYKQCHRVTGDHGEALAKLQRVEADRSVPIEDADEFLAELAAMRRNDSKLLSLERYLGPLHPLVIKVLVRIITRRLVTGLREEDWMRALSVSCDQPLERIQAAYAASWDLPLTARQAATDTLPAGDASQAPESE